MALLEAILLKEILILAFRCLGIRWTGVADIFFVFLL